ncbi:hypothetical protein EK21DRAFT_116161 [Setomelanomma holmii]|uniref:Uncharacterized protein n=1 Tax=Setomelanomma holmii TaxID=210430 RepID=A0A9P4LJG5_9PLEO|nr:hypothetical protein EK21DRAFT_116161 [Setomelanomma holmii]
MSPDPRNDQSHYAEDVFRFLDLPTELRCMVYELIDHEAQNISIHLSSSDLFGEDLTKSIVLTSNGLPVALLATCRLVRIEAQPFFKPKPEASRTTERFRITAGSKCGSVLMKRRNNLMDVVKNRRKAHNLGASFQLPEWCSLGTLDEPDEVHTASAEYEHIDGFTKKCTWFLPFLAGFGVAGPILLSEDRWKLGYEPFFVDRQMLIQILYDNLNDKSNVLTTKGVIPVPKRHHVDLYHDERAAAPLNTSLLRYLTYAVFVCLLGIAYWAMDPPFDLPSPTTFLGVEPKSCATGHSQIDGIPRFIILTFADSIG